MAAFVQEHSFPGSDPGVCVVSAVPAAVSAFGRRVQSELVCRADALDLAGEYGLYLRGLGGTEDGVIGALASVGLAATGNDGRFILVGTIRALSGVQPIDAVLAAGISAVRTLEGEPVTAGLVDAAKLRPSLRDGQPVLFVAPGGDVWQPLKLD